jgi:RND family efflux transporter MFP subunit
MLVRARSGLAWLVALGLAACGSRPAAVPPPQLPDLEVLQVEAGGAPAALAWDGVVQAQEQTLLSAQTSGRVLRLLADVDQRVARGAVLLRLTDAEQRAAVDDAAAQLRAAEAQLVDAAARYRRAVALVERQLVSRDEFDRVRAAHDAAAAARDAAEARLLQARQQLDYTTVAAPYDAIVATRLVETGQTVAPGQPLFALYMPDRLRVEVQLPQTQAEAVRAAPAARVWLADGRELRPRQVIVFPAADPGAHSTAVRLQLPPVPDAPRPGQTVKVRFDAVAAPAGIWLPAAAVVQRGELAAAYVVRDGAIVLRQLRIGRSDAGRVEVIAGLSPGEQVAADPSRALMILRAQRAGRSDGG